MLRVFICEDRREHRDRITKFIENILIIEDFDMKLGLSTSNPYEILSYIKDSGETGLYFLDVDLNCDINGIKLAEKIREIDPRAFIVFVTTHAEMSYLTFMYKVEAMDYILKDENKDFKDRIHQCIIESMKRHKSNNRGENKVFTTKSNDKIISIEYKNIMFFETSQTIHKVKLHSINRQVEFYSKMKELEQLLDDDFIRCHNSFIVNKNNIKELDIKNRILKMKNGEECLVSSRGMKLVKNK